MIAIYVPSSVIAEKTRHDFREIRVTDFFEIITQPAVRLRKGNKPGEVHGSCDNDAVTRGGFDGPDPLIVTANNPSPQVPCPLRDCERRFRLDFPV